MVWVKLMKTQNAVTVMNKSRTCKTSELDQVANTVIVSPTQILLDNCDKAWVYVPVPKPNKLTGTWAWCLRWCTAYDERLVSMTVTSYMLIPNKPRYVDPDHENDVSTTCTTGHEVGTICTRRAIELGFGGRPVRHCPACGKLVLASKIILLDNTMPCSVSLQRRCQGNHH